MPKHYKMKCEPGRIGLETGEVSKPKFTHFFVPAQRLRRFNLKIPFLRGIIKKRKVAIKVGERELFSKNVFSFGKRIKFKIPENINLEIGIKHTLVII